MSNLGMRKAQRRIPLAHELPENITRAVDAMVAQSKNAANSSNTL